MKSDSSLRPTIIAVILLVGQFLLMTINAQARITKQSLPRTLILTATYPIQKGLAVVTTSVGHVWKGYVSLWRAAEENQNLRRELSQLKRERTELQETIASHKRLQDLLKLKESFQSPTIAANVIGRDGSPWYKQVIIDQGTLAGVHLNHIVITPDGVVGRVVSVGPSSAMVLMITHGDAGVGAMLAESRTNGELRGRNELVCQLDSISGLTQVRVGEAVLTTGLDGFYPKGLLLGYVTQVQLGSGAGLHQISVRPAAQLDRLEEVLVLLSRASDVQMTESVKKEKE
ncbi:MAG: rod shape-determining protein MreC [Acidobacteria bacterium]|nr:rod shape-determining protein MreC [Acidobacteriota bacterium]